jgi:hypothetical protein
MMENRGSNAPRLSYCAYTGVEREDARVSWRVDYGGKE